MSAASRAAEILAEAGAVITGSHVVYTSGRHGSAYVNKDAVYPHTERVAELCGLLADATRATRPEVEMRWSASTSGRSLTAPGRMSTTSGVATMRASSGMR